MLSGIDRRVSYAALADAALALSSRTGTYAQNVKQHRKINPQALGLYFHSAAVRADAAVVKAQNLCPCVPTFKKEVAKKTQNTKAGVCQGGL